MRSSMLAIMLRPRSVGLLLLAIVIAVLFSLLGQWQLERAVESGRVVERETETSVALETIAVPQEQMRDTATGQLVYVAGSYVPGDFDVVEDRQNGGESGTWVVGHFRAEGAGAAGDPADLAVAVGWAADLSAARVIAEDLGAQPEADTVLAGRYVPSEAPEAPDEDADPQSMASMSVAQLVNRWTSPAVVYPGYLVASEAPTGLTAIDSPAPGDEVELNFLNVFYAAEWALFAVIALAIWYRMMRDVHQAENDPQDPDDDDSDPDDADDLDSPGDGGGARQSGEPAVVRP